MKISPLEYFRKIREIAIIAMFSDDYLMNRLVLKGGNLLDIVYKISDRTSLDLDFSIEDDFNREELDKIEIKLEKVLQTTFNEEGFIVFDFKFFEKPKRRPYNAADFWGGYKINLKIIEKDKLDNLGDKSLASMRRNASTIAGAQKRTFTIDISKYEYCKAKQTRELNDYMIHVYSLPMIVFEKLRSICQQMPEYKRISRTIKPTGRSRDFFDIYTILENKKFSFEPTTPENIELLKLIFQAKQVPLEFLKKIKEQRCRDFHEQDFVLLKITIKPNAKIRDFSFYYDYVVKKSLLLEKSLGIV